MYYNHFLFWFLFTNFSQLNFFQNLFLKRYRFRIKRNSSNCLCQLILVRSKGFEPLTFWSVVRCSIRWATSAFLTLNLSWFLNLCFAYPTERRRRDLNPRGGFIPLPLSRRVPWTGLGDASCIRYFLTEVILKAFSNLRAEGVGFEPTRSVNPFRFSRPVPSATRRALHRLSSHSNNLTSFPVRKST